MARSFARAGIGNGHSANERLSYLRPPVLLTTQVTRAFPKPEAVPTQTPDATTAATPAAEPTPESTAVPGPAFFTYTVQPGDTVDSIAGQFGLKPQYIMWNNTEVGSDPDYLIPGQDVLIPSVNGLVYSVKLGDTLTDIAAFYQIDLQSIVAFLPNSLSSADMVKEGMVLLLPEAVPPPPPPPPILAAVAAVEATAPEPQAFLEEGPPAPEPPPASVSGFIWPFAGPVSSPFGDGRGHTGIDIDGFGQYGAPVVAAAGGQVVLVSYQEYGLGNHIIIRHDNGLETIYAHLSDMYVGLGQFVSQGEIIGAIGCTGYCSGPHLHFEVREGGIPVDPLLYLP